MNVDGVPYRTIWPGRDGETVEIIDQTRLPFDFVVKRLETLDDAATAIRDMWVRGAPLIGAAAAYGMALGVRDDASDAGLAKARETLIATRPTAVNLRWAVDDMIERLTPLAPDARAAAAFARAAAVCDEDVATCSAIGDHGLGLIAEAYKRTGQTRPVNILTHCNAGWLATVDWGTATAPMYKAHNAGIPIHVWVDETRPRNQGASLTAWELGHHGVGHTVIADNAGGHLMQTGQVDLCLVGTDRTTRTGDVANKIGTYLKALAAHDTGVPFYVGLPGTTIDWTLDDGADVPIEERSAREVSHIAGRDETGAVRVVDVLPVGSPAANPAFDVTPARYVTGLITERGVAEAREEALRALYPEK
jgi:methylthioribose-1-phosphate isomerase